MRSYKMYPTLGLVTIAAVAGCAGTPMQVVSLGPDSYYVSVTGARLESQADTNYRALGAANDYCDKMGKQLLFRQSRESGDFSWSAKREDLTFVCMSGADPSYMHAGLEHDKDAAPADVVVAKQ